MARLTKGHLRAWAGNHPYANGRREMYVHVMVMELHLGRALRPGERVHHINGVKHDNRIENLEIVDHSKHSSEHNKELVKTRKRDSKGRFTQG